MTVKFTIKSKMPTLNDYIDAERANRYKAAKMKKEWENVVIHSARSLGKWRAEKKVIITYHHYEPDMRRDKDNVNSFARKVVQDALVKCKVLHNDGWKDIEKSQEEWYVDKENPRIIVEIMEED